MIIVLVLVTKCDEQGMDKACTITTTESNNTKQGSESCERCGNSFLGDTCFSQHMEDEHNLLIASNDNSQTSETSEYRY